jgi:ribosomal protein S6E (S10)
MNIVPTLVLSVVFIQVCLAAHGQVKQPNTIDTKANRSEKARVSDGVSGVIVDDKGKILANAQISTPGSQVERTNANGDFRYPLPKGQQRVLEAHYPGFQNWYGSARAGDVVRIQLQKKTKIEQTAGKRKLSVRLIDSQTAEPISGLIVQVEKYDGPQVYQIAAERLTDKEGIAEFDGLEIMRYRLRQKATKPIPYIPTISYPGSADVDEVVVLLKRACELTLRAVDSETGEGIQGVQFDRERAEAEFWADAVVSDTIPVDRDKHKNTLTDNAGYAHFLVGPETWSYMIRKYPKGYNSVVPINGGYETALETPVGGKVEYTFRLTKTKAAPD